MRFNIFKPKSNTPKAKTEVMREPKYIELDWKTHTSESKEYVRVLPLNDFSDVEGILDYLRDRNNIIILKIKPRLLQEKLELKRALKRIQRTCQAIGGDIAGIREDIIIVTPPQVEIARKSQISEKNKIEEEIGSLNY